MNSLLTKIKLIDHLVVELDIDKTTFISKLKARMDESDLGWFSDSFDVFSSSKNDYKGQVSLDGFKIKKRKRLFDPNMHLAIASGTFRQNNGILFVDVEISGLPNMMVFVMAVLLFVYLTIIGNIIAGGSIRTDFPLPLFIIIYGLMMLGIPYLVMRQNVRHLKNELERDLFYFAKK